MIRGLPYHGPAADVWSMGVILYALVCGYLPFEHTNISKLYHKILAGRFSLPSSLSPAVSDLISRILVTDPRARYSVSDIRRHLWYRQLEQGEEGKEEVVVEEEEVEESKHNNENDLRDWGVGTQAVERERGEKEVDEEEVLNEAVLQEAENLGLDREELRMALQQHMHNSLTATYHLLIRRKNSSRSPGFAGKEDVLPTTEKGLTPAPPAAQPPSVAPSSSSFSSSSSPSSSSSSSSSSCSSSSISSPLPQNFSTHLHIYI